MARDYAKIYTSIRDDDEFRLLGPAAQGLYFQLLIGEVSKAGTFWWRPKKLAQLFGSTTPDDIETIGTELADHRFVLIDYDTDEALVRSFIRHDGILKSPNMVKSMVATWRDIGSQVIKDVVLNQVRREVERTPSLRDLHVLPEVFKEPSESVDETLPSGFPNRTLPETLTERVAETPRQGFAIRETGDGRRETGSGKRETGSGKREREQKSREPGTGNREPRSRDR